MYVCRKTTCTLGRVEVRGGYQKSPVTGVIGGCEPHGCWESSTGFLQEQQVFLTAELSPQPLTVWLWIQLGLESHMRLQMFLRAFLEMINQGREGRLTPHIIAPSFGLVAQMAVKEKNEKASLASAVPFLFPCGSHRMHYSQLLWLSWWSNASESMV